MPTGMAKLGTSSRVPESLVKPAVTPENLASPKSSLFPRGMPGDLAARSQLH